MVSSGGRAGGGVLPGVGVFKNAAYQGTGSESRVLMFELRDKLLISAGKELKRHPKAFFRNKLTSVDVTR